jgi:hypothetical protein
MDRGWDMLEAVGIMLLVGVVVMWGRQALLSQRRHYEHAFAKLVFDTPRGLVTGQSLKVVHRTVSLPRSEQGLSGVPASGANYWFCVGPGPSYFLAVPLSNVANGLGTHLEWVVRPLTAERMRGALSAKPAALRRAFPQAVLSE